MDMNWDSPRVGSPLWQFGNVKRRKLSEWVQIGFSPDIETFRTACVEYRLEDDVVSDVRAVIYDWAVDNSARAEPIHVLPDPEDLEQVVAWVAMTMAIDGYQNDETFHSPT